MNGNETFSIRTNSIYKLSFNWEKLFKFRFIEIYMTNISRIFQNYIIQNYPIQETE